ncbi:hypothetical protein TSUD_126430 [Trifolium subterraneum]|uniref:Uncharacterized protein n=1 Tax=Trifolium subterraneum TaxID=3900 RepID=A0A2Z6NE16_TRISU|nr:hypothetical protein TSUD_126430 [Trifolium subterraneum]
MTFITRLCLLGLLLTYAAMCFARNMPIGNRNSQYDIDDYGEPVANPAHDPKNPPLSAPSQEDYGESGANPAHDPKNPPRSTPSLGNQNNQYDIEDYGPPGPNPGHDPKNPPPSPPPLGE